MKTSCIAAAVFTALMIEPVYAATVAGFIAHEWGTFTSVQSSDGTLIRWNPFQTAELPAFVYNRQRPDRTSEFAALQTVTGKTGTGSTAWFQRMETPVIYFYASQPLTADVSVKFPQGLITEWYPQVRQFGPVPTLQNIMPASSESFVSWPELQLLPGNQSTTSSMLPTDGSGSHYFAARETDSTVLRVTKGLTQTTNVEQEKFLFYRGVGNFAAPLRVLFESERELVLENTGSEVLHRLFVLEVRAEGAAFVSASNLVAGAKARITLPQTNSVGPTNAVVDQISRAMEQSLITEGLYPREAAAMVKSWRDSWFAEEGVRVLYLLPRSWADRVLPLTISPAPAELMRVMVGRAEVFTPELERQLHEVLSLYRNLATRPQALEAMRQLHLGRFLEPALTRLTTLAEPAASSDIESLKSTLKPALPAASR